MTAPGAPRAVVDPDTRWHDAIEARSDHSRGCRDGCPLTPCPTGQQINDAEQAAYLEARRAWEARRTRVTNRLLTAGLVVYMLVMAMADGWFYVLPQWPRLSAAWGG